MRRLLTRLVLAFLALAFAAVALANRQPVALSLPWSEFALMVPLWAVFFLGLLCGVTAAGIVTLPPRVRDSLSRREALRRAERAEARLAEIDEARAAQRRDNAVAAIDRAQRRPS